ncbi:polyprenyl diphosphate synthase [Streptomyces sp. NBC_01613]|uniref:polyprenyl diphosphate synthase n=1 Tax=Streptomyces sp. NBC_01613 TaxID=2975896 RepID=UPI003868BA8D
MAVQQATISLPHQLPKHIALIPDGNRRWARQRGLPAGAGFRQGAARIPEVLGWCDQAGVQTVTLWMLSPGNLRRGPEECAAMLTLVEESVAGLARAGRWRLAPVGDLGLLPEPTAERLRAAERATRHVRGMLVHLAVAYSGRNAVVSALRSYLSGPTARDETGDRIAATLTAELIDAHMTAGDWSEPDLVIRTSGEQRMSGFLAWQAAESELFFCPALWPDFTEQDLRTALHSYGARERRYGR